MALSEFDIQTDLSELEPADKSEVAGIVKIWQGLTLDRLQKEIAQRIDVEKLRPEIASLINDFIRYYNPQNPAQYLGPKDLDESFDLLKDLDDKMRLFLIDADGEFVLNSAEASALDFMHHYVIRDLLSAKLAIRHRNKALKSGWQSRSSLL